MGQYNSRQLVMGQTSFDPKTRPTGSINYDMIGKDGDAQTVTQPVLAPVSSNSNQLYSLYYSPISSPFQITMFGNPYSDLYYVHTVKPYFDFQSIFDNSQGSEVKMTYEFTATHCIVSDGNRIVKTYTLLDCPSGCTFQSSATVSWSGGTVFTLTNDNCTTILDMAGINAYVMFQKQKQLILGNYDDRIFAQAQLSAYLLTINQIQLFVGINPFCMLEPNKDYTDYQSNLAVQLSYPYMIYAQLMLLSGWNAVPDDLVGILNMAISFVSQWARPFWTINHSFEYGYLEAGYISLYKQTIITNTSLYTL